MSHSCPSSGSCASRRPLSAARAARFGGADRQSRTCTCCSKGACRTSAVWRSSAPGTRIHPFRRCAPRSFPPGAARGAAAPRRRGPRSPAGPPRIRRLCAATRRPRGCPPGPRGCPRPPIRSFAPCRPPFAAYCTILIMAQTGPFVNSVCGQFRQNLLKGVGFNHYMLAFLAKIK